MKLQEKGKFVEGIFGIETYSNGELVDTYTQKNMIMTTARNNMSALIAGFTTGVPIDGLVLGDFGHDGDLLTPKTFVEGREALFSEVDEHLTRIAFSSANKTLTYQGTTDFTNLVATDLIRIIGSTSNDGDYTVTNVDTVNGVITVSEALVDEPEGAKITITKDPLGTPYVYNTDGIKDGHTFDVTFTPPTSAGFAAITNITDTLDVAYDPGSIDDVTVEVDSTGNVTKYIIFIPQNKANNAHVNDVDVIAYTEAALYAGGNIFSMRTFPARTKDSNLEFKITWSITF